MALTAQQIRDAWRVVLEQDSAVGRSFTKPDLQAAATAVDTWCTSNQASFVAALPEPFKTTSNAQQKALLLATIAMKRTGVL